MLQPLVTNTFHNTVAHAGLTVQLVLLLTVSTLNVEDNGRQLTCLSKTSLTVVMLDLAKEEMIFQSTPMPTKPVFQTKLATTTKLLMDNALTSMLAELALQMDLALPFPNMSTSKLVTTDLLLVFNKCKLKSMQEDQFLAVFAQPLD